MRDRKSENGFEFSVKNTLQIAQSHHSIFQEISIRCAVQLFTSHLSDVPSNFSGSLDHVALFGVLILLFGGIL